MSTRHRLRVGLAVMNHSQPGLGGGLDIYTRHLVEALAEHDHDNDYVIITKDAAQAELWRYRTWPGNFRIHALREYEARQGLTTRTVRRWRLWRGQAVPAHYGEPYRSRQIEELELDLLHFPDTLIEPLSVSTPCVLTFFDMQHEYYPRFFSPEHLAWRAARYRPSVDKAAHLLVPSHFTASTLSERYGVAPSKMSLAPVGVQPGFQRATPKDVDRVRERYGLPERYLFYPANPWPHKNHARLMAALRIYGERFGRAPELVLSGRLANEPRDATELARAAGVEASVHNLDFVAFEDMPALYTGAAAMVFPSFFEGFGIPLLEAMACGCPIAAADATAIPECVGDAAVLFDPFDPECIANALHSLLSDEELQRTLVARGSARLAQYRWQELAPQITAVYRQVAGRTPAVGSD